jgi:hypothetical protein
MRKHLYAILEIVGIVVLIAFLMVGLFWMTARFVLYTTP